MSPTARALRQRFDEVCHSELQRLGRKTKRSSEAEKTELSAVSFAIVRSISEHVGAVLEAEHDAGLDAVVITLFSLSPAEGGPGQCGERDSSTQSEEQS
jgi:hypothetical protein